MKILNRLKLVAVLPVALAVIVTGVMLVSLVRVHTAMRQKAVADAVVQGVFELSLLTYEYGWHPGDQPQGQWQAKHGSLGRLLRNVEFSNHGDRELHRRALIAHKQLGQLFRWLETASHGGTEANEGVAVDDSERRNRLMGQVLVKAHQLVSIASQLAAASGQTVSGVLLWTALFVAVSVVATGAGLSVTSSLVIRNISARLEELSRGTRIVGQGNLAYRLRSTRQDELGALARAFDAMTAELETITVSRDDLAREVSDRKNAERELRRLTDELARSNRELEQFAYVASHDLQEPLRTVASFAQLLARRYRGRLDSDADEFIDFISDAAKRAQALINDLLHFSRVGTQGKPFVPTNCAEVVDEVRGGLTVAIEESGAEITTMQLPTINADRTQLSQLFQNLIGNALKFRRDGVPVRVRVSARREGGFWHFAVIDNGIGIEPQYFERIFHIFQRLHGSRYDGTGIGLAVCKKIVERHGGTIRAESEPGQGTAFHFAIPATLGARQGEDGNEVGEV